MSIVDIVLEKTRGTRWNTLFLVFLVASALVTFTGPSIQWVVNSYASDKLDEMLEQRGVTKQSFRELQQKTDEVNTQTDEIRADIAQIKRTVEKLANEQNRVSIEFKESKEQAIQDRRELKSSVDAIYNYLLNHRRSDR